jgi:hypothetical protein
VKSDVTTLRTGDRGTAYAFLIVTNDDQLGVIGGQGASRRALTFVDPRDRPGAKVLHARRPEGRLPL